MFLLKEGSRHSYNQDRADLHFSNNIKFLLGINLVHGDCFNDVLHVLDEHELQQLKACLIKTLIEQEVIRPDQLSGKFTVAIDGTGTHSFTTDYSGRCLHKTSKNGAVSYSHAVLEAKLVTSGGVCLSLASEWIDNGSEGFDKQDCEMKAFQRLSEKLKQLYPELPILLVADALYCNLPVIHTAEQNKWDYMLVIKEGVQKSLNEEIALRPDMKTFAIEYDKGGYLNDLELGEYRVNYLKWEEVDSRFSWLTNLKIHDPKHASGLQKIARSRWMIENEGFNTQKNLGYSLEHKYSRTSYQAVQNYYQCLQIAHLIEQVALLATAFKKLVKKCKTTIIKISERIRNILVISVIDLETIAAHHKINST